MLWRILPHATCCFASEKLFLLDLRQDRYFAVPPALAASMRTWLDQSFSCRPPENVVDLLTKSRVLRPGDDTPTNALKERTTIPSRIGELAPPKGNPISRSRQWLAIASTWSRLRLLPLYHILEERRNRASLPASSQTEAVTSLAAGYEAMRSYTPITRNCLLDSLALDSLLARTGLGATLVFGVCPTPFSAHCWLQTDELILNDSFDHVSRFTPIYAA